MLIKAFELLAREIANLSLGERIQITEQQLIHLVHQQLTIFGWEILATQPTPK